MTERQDAASAPRQPAHPDEPMNVGEAVGIDGHELVAWVVPSVNWLGRPRFTPQVERHFVTWGVFWRGAWKSRSWAAAEKRALAVLHRLDRKGGRREHV